MRDSGGVRLQYVFVEGHVAAEGAVIRQSGFFVAVAIGKHLAAKTRVSAFVAFCGLFHQQYRCAFFGCGLCGHGACAAESDDNNVVLAVPCNGLFVSERFAACFALRAARGEQPRPCQPKSRKRCSLKESAPIHFFAHVSS